MNIRNRIKKIEETSKFKGGETCKCFDKHIQASISKVYGDDFNPAGILTDSYELTGICEKCNKPTSTITNNLVENIVKIYGEATI